MLRTDLVNQAITSLKPFSDTKSIAYAIGLLEQVYPLPVISTDDIIPHLLGEGHTLSSIARDLGVTPSAVKNNYSQGKIPTRIKVLIKQIYKKDVSDENIIRRC